MNYSGKVYAKIGGRYVPLDATAEEIDKWKEAYESQPKQLSDEESLWDTLNAVISSHYGDCSSLPELIDGFGVRKDGRSLSLWEAIKVALDEIEAYRDRTGGGVDLRPPLARFVAIMEDQLKANDHKPGWEDDGLFALFARLSQESDELHHEIFYSKDPSTIEKEAADVANFAMMIADNARRITQRNQQEKG